MSLTTLHHLPGAWPRSSRFYCWVNSFTPKQELPRFAAWLPYCPYSPNSKVLYWRVKLCTCLKQESETKPQTTRHQKSERPRVRTHKNDNNTCNARVTRVTRLVGTISLEGDPGSSGSGTILSRFFVDEIGLKLIVASLTKFNNSKWTALVLEHSSTQVMCPGFDTNCNGILRRMDSNRAALQDFGHDYGWTGGSAADLWRWQVSQSIDFVPKNSSLWFRIYTIRHGRADGHKVLNGITRDLRLSSSLSWRSLRITRLLQFATLTYTDLVFTFLTFRKHLFPSGSSLRHRRIHAASQLHNLLWSSNTSCGSTLTTRTTQLNHSESIPIVSIVLSETVQRVIDGKLSFLDPCEFPFNSPLSLRVGAMWDSES